MLRARARRGCVNLQPLTHRARRPALHIGLRHGCQKNCQRMPTGCQRPQHVVERPDNYRKMTENSPFPLSGGTRKLASKNGQRCHHPSPLPSSSTELFCQWAPRGLVNASGCPSPSHKLDRQEPCPVITGCGSGVGDCARMGAVRGACL